MTSDVPRLGVIGTGPWARRLHIPAAAASERVRFAAVLGRDAARTAESVATTTARPLVDLSEFLDAVDIVAFAVPPAAQAELASTVIDAGKHVLLEKPVALDSEAAVQLAERVERRGIRSIVFLPHRLAPDLDAWAAAARSTGGWTLGRVEAWSSVLVDPASIYHGSAWRHESGALWDVGPHALAQLTSVLGRVTSVVATRGPGDLTSLVLEHESGAQGIATVAADLPDPAPQAAVTTYVGATGRADQPAVGDWGAFTSRAWDAAVAHLANDSATTMHHTDVSYGVHLTAVLAAAERSIGSARREEVRESR
jgi:predicted dehydrogenase